MWIHKADALRVRNEKHLGNRCSTSYQLGTMRRKGKYYFSVMEDANCNAHIISVGHGPHESIEGWEAFLRPIRNTVARIDKSKFEEVVEETRRGGVRLGEE